MQSGWMVPAYTMPKNIEDMVVMRIVVRQGMSRDMADMLLADIRNAVAELEKLAYPTTSRIAYEKQEKELKGIVLAGAFGTYLPVESAVRIGLLPEIATEQIVAVGNAALEGAVYGAKKCFISSCEQAKSELEKIARSAKHIPLAEEKDFQEEEAFSKLEYIYQSQLCTSVYDISLCREYWYDHF